METATHWVLTHRGPAGEGAEAPVCADVASLAPHSRQVSRERLADELAAAIASRGEMRDAVVTDSPTGGSKHDVRCGEEPDHGPVHELSHQVTGCQIRLRGSLRRAQVIALLEGLPDWVIRAKTLVRLREEPGVRWLFERTARDPVPPPIRVPKLTHVPASLVCVGPALDPIFLRQHVVKCLGADAIAPAPEGSGSRTEVAGKH